MVWKKLVEHHSFPNVNCGDPKLRTIAQFWLECTPDKGEVIGSSPISPTNRLMGL